MERARAWTKRAISRAGALFVLLGLLFALTCAARDGVCLASYRWDAAAGFLPVATRCPSEHPPSVADGAAFWSRAAWGATTLRSGRSREDAGRTLQSLLARRGARSLAVLGIASGLIWLLAFAARRVPRWMRPPAGLPLPVASFLVFALVLRLVPAGSVLDYDRAGLLWAGLALALSDGVARLLVDGVAQLRAREAARPWADTLAMWGRDPGPAIDAVTRPERAAQVRGAAVAMLGGLVVVEAVFGVNGLGETLKDLVVDRQGLDPLLLAGVLAAFGAAVLAIDLAPIEALSGGAR